MAGGRARDRGTCADHASLPRLSRSRFYTFGWEQLPPADRLAESGLARLDKLESRVTVEFRDLGDATEVRLTPERLDTEDLLAFHRWGWRSSLDRLADVL